MLAGLGVTTWLHSQHSLDIVVIPARETTAHELPPNSSFPLISVVVPARNEARNIRRCLNALLAQTYPALEVIVLDDRSSDETPAILAEIQKSRTEAELPQASPHLQIIRGEEIPPGWAGKPHALVQGAGAAQGEWLCFVDADTFASLDLIQAAYFKAKECGAGMFSILTDQELGSFWEKVVLPIVFTALSVGFPARRVNDPHAPDAIANGQFILIRRSIYEAVGGHGSVKDRIDEDKGLAEVVKGAGYRLLLADGRQVARTRMYTSLAEMWEGWTKNIFAGMRGRLGLLLFGAILGLMGAILLPIWLFGSTAWYVVTGGWVPAVMTVEAVVLWYFLIWSRAQAARAFHIHPAYAFTLPLAALVFTAMMAASAFKVLSGKGVSWRGRIYRP
jgi:chlorobactene glucosyltransferase